MVFGGKCRWINFLDYREELDPTTRWSDRLQSSSGEWSGNVCDFYFRVYNKIIKDIKVPFKMVGGERIDDTPVHKALREALANCLIMRIIMVCVVLLSVKNQTSSFWQIRVMSERVKSRCALVANPIPETRLL